MTTLKESSAIEQLNKLIEFRQSVYDEVFIKARDVQFETMDSLLLSDHPRSFAELSLSPVFRRQWSSLYDAVGRGRQDEERLARLLVDQVPGQGVQVFPLDTTMWSHPRARTLSDLVYAPSPTRALKHRSIVQGHQSSLISWAPEAGSSGSPVVLSRRVKANESEIGVGVAQVKQLCRYRLGAELMVITADGRYGTHHFFAPLKQTNCALVARLRCDRVLYGEPGVYGGRGRPRKHGDRFAFKEPDTWPEPDEVAEYEHPDWGQVRLQAWRQLHARQDADLPFHASSGPKSINNGSNPRPPYGWPISRLPTRIITRFNKSGVGLRNAGRLNQPSVFENNTWPGPCHVYKQPMPVTVGPD